jgi:NitT/TauT family transport system substrate-binding protein
MHRILLIIVLTLCACESKPSAPLRIGFNPWPGYEFIYLAKVKEIYSKAGLDVKLVELNTLGDVRRAFERGQIDIMASTTVEVMIAAENTSNPIKIIAIPDTSIGADVFLTKRTIQAIGQLRGKRIGMETGTVDSLNSHYALNSAGLNLSEVIIVSKTQDDLSADFEQGKLDALQTYPPYSAKFLSNTQFHKLFDTSQIPGKVLDVISVSNKALKERGPEIKKFIQSFFIAMDYYHKHSVEAAQIMGERTKGDSNSFMASLEGIQLIAKEQQTDYLNNKLRHALQSTSDALLTTGNLKTAAKIDAFLDPASLDFYR